MIACMECSAMQECRRSEDTVFAASVLQSRIAFHSMRATGWFFLPLWIYAAVSPIFFISRWIACWSSICSGKLTKAFILARICL